MDRASQKKVWPKLWSELSDPGILHFLKTSAKNEDGMSKSVYKAETPGDEVHRYTCACVCD